MAQNEETRIQNRCLIDASKHHDVMVWRQQVGKYRSLHSDAVISIGDVGMSDIGMIVGVKITPDMIGRTIGAYVGVEIKTSKGRQSNEQKDWQRVIEGRCGLYRIARSTEEMQEIIESVRSGEAFK